MCIPLHICLLMVKEAYISDQGQGKSLVLNRLIKDGKWKKKLCLGWAIYAP